MRIVADENIACLPETFALQGELVTRAGRSLVADDVRTADALIVRSVTRVDESLLAGSRVRFVGSCTIGTDHVDLDYLARAGICFAHAPGCNAQAVAEYVVTALFEILGDIDQWQTRRVGIVGLGNAGSSLAQVLDRLEVSWAAFDPLIERSSPKLVAFDEVLQCDIVSLHVPLSRHGSHATHHWFDAQLLRRLKPDAVLINAARGAVIDNADLLALLKAGRSPKVVLDVFENEPAIDSALLHEVTLGTPHIAGYSVQGKERGTWQVYRAFCDFLGVMAVTAGEQKTVDLDCGGCAKLRDVIQRAYDIAGDDARLRQGGIGNIAEHFDALRKHYPSRQEWSNRRLIQLDRSALPQVDIDRLLTLGFKRQPLVDASALVASVS
jgi:erythronate-4-phosphate dehydrogenase